MPHLINVNKVKTTATENGGYKVTVHISDGRIFYGETDREKLVERFNQKAHDEAWHKARTRLAEDVLQEQGVDFDEIDFRNYL